MATIVRSADWVIEKADETLNEILRERRLQDEAMVDEEFNRTGFFGRTLYRCKEEAIAALKNDNFSWFPSEHGWRTEKRVKKLKQLAENSADGSVTLNEQDIEDLT